MAQHQLHVRSAELEKALPIYGYYAIYWAVTVPAIFLMVFRLWIRWQKHGSLYIDDLFVFFAGFFCFVIAVMHTLITPYIFDIMEAQAGLVTPDAEWMKRIYMYLKMQWATIFIFWQLLWSVKFSLLLFFRRLMDGIDGMMKWWWAVVCLNTMLWISVMLSQFVNCRPFSSSFKLGPEACSTRQPTAPWEAMIYAMVADVITDIMIMALPLRLIINLKISAKQKFGLVIIFSLGLLCIAFALIRALLSSVGDSISPIWLTTWTQVEGSVAVVVACLPALRGLLRKNYGSTGGEEYMTGGGAVRGSHIQLEDSHVKVEGEGVVVHAATEPFDSRGGYEGMLESTEELTVRVQPKI
ncbi:hypothetical protein DFP73DRAFT_598599 [Morchella snyderi]|nr:hypothetical protein DFP73DRAFT_598599 [Morchella snyderi]